MEVYDLTSQRILSEMFYYILDIKLAVMQPEANWKAALQSALDNDSIRKPMFDADLREEFKTVPQDTDRKELIRFLARHGFQVIVFFGTPTEYKTVMYYQPGANLNPKRWVFLAQFAAPPLAPSPSPVTGVAAGGVGAAIRQAYYVFAPFFTDPFHRLPNQHGVAQPAPNAQYRQEKISHYQPDNDWNFPVLY